jgi:tetratricopeptide (TPR) repeat protein
MRSYLLGLLLPLVVSFCLATRLEPWFQNWAGARAPAADLIHVALGDSRKLLAQQFYVKADVYFHSGYYPTVYDARPVASEMHIAADVLAGPEHEREEEAAEFLGKPKDWIDRFSRHFYPTQHRHLGEEDHQTNSHAGHTGEERELLPWLRLAATLDPKRPETYVVASYWLRSRLGKVDEAERFLREGMQANPGDSGILFELGRIYDENRQDPTRARNVWELALQHWRERQANEPDPDLLLGAQILGHLAKLEEKQHHSARAIEHLQALKLVSPNKESIQKWIEEVQGMTNEK